MNSAAPTPPLTTMKRNCPRGLIAEIIFKLNRWPVTLTTGVCSLLLRFAQIGLQFDLRSAQRKLKVS